MSEASTSKGVRARVERLAATRPARIARSFLESVRGDDVMGLSAELAFRWLLAIFPLLVMTGALAGFAATSLGLDDPTEQVIDALGSAMPAEAAATLRPQLERVLESRDGGLLGIGLALTILAASAGMRALIKALNRVYGVDETRPFWRQMTVALVLTVLAGIAALVSVVAVSVGQVTATRLAELLGFERVVAGWLDLATIPVAVLAMLGLTAFLYRVAVARRTPLRWVLPGALAFAPSWLIATWLFSLYVSNFGSYDDVYGALAGIVILLLWFYLTAVLLLLGGELNATLERAFGDGSSAGEGDERPAAA